MSPSDASPVPAEQATRTRRRLSDLLDLHVVGRGGTELGRVSDVRLTPGTAGSGALEGLVVDGFVAGDSRIGSRLGYDRRPDQGPWLIRVVVRLIQRHAGYVPWGAVRDVDWAAARVTVDLHRPTPLKGGDLP
jgi:sporulation protein YlmC with PRC-barrel domain